ncbi:MAG: PKD domain-containing protein, partial [Reichenbachiella sp.]
DFNGDNMENASTAVADYSFSTDGVGTYSVSLNVANSDGCTNNTSQEIILYNAPDTPDFDFSPTSVCSNADITFSNLSTETGIEDVVTYAWDFGNGDVSTDKNPTYAFATAATNSVSLTATIPGCTSDPYAEDVIVADGPSVNFSYLNNCTVGSTINFTDASSSGTAWSWDFGDGTGSSSDQNPSYTFATAGDYEVTLTVTDGACNTPYSQTITISDDPKTSFSYGETTVNIPVNFTGNDLTIDDDAITSWQWDFDGLGESNEQNPSFTFNTTGGFIVSLQVTTAQGCAETTNQTITIDPAQCPTSDFSVASEFCMEESIEFTNNSVNASSYLWDFCSGELFETPSESSIFSIPGASDTRDIEIVFDGSNWYGFALDRSANFMHRLDFGISLDSIPVIGWTTDLSGNLDKAAPIQIVQEGDNWHAIIHNGASSTIIRLDFGTAITNESPMITTVISGIGTVTDDNLALANDNGNWVGVIPSYTNNNFTIINFGNSITNTPDPSTDIITTAAISNSGMIDISLYNECGLWYGLSGGTKNKNIYHLSFGADLFSDPTISSIGTVPNGPFGIDFTYQIGEYVGYVQGISEGLYRIKLGDDLANPTLVVEEQTGIATGLTAGMTLKYDHGYWKAFQIQSNGTLYRIDFPLDCGVNEGGSSEVTPTNITYQQEGIYQVSLRAFDDNGTFTEDVQSVTITSSTAPNISFSIDDSRCIDNTNTFTAIDEGDIASYSWDFNGDN